MEIYGRLPWQVDAFKCEYFVKFTYVGADSLISQC